MVLQTPSDAYRPLAPAGAGYQGLTNYATWAVNAHLASDTALYHEVLRPICTPAPDLLTAQWPAAKIKAADELRRYAEGLFAGLLGRSMGVTDAQKGMLIDLMQNSMDNINYREIVNIHWNK
jgi:hypothetical protein